GFPNATHVPESTLAEIGEGSFSNNGRKLLGNNEDLTLLRAAYTTDGVNFTDLGPISGAGTENGASYDDITNPDQTSSPSNTAPTSLPEGASDTTEMRWVGSRGT